MLAVAGLALPVSVAVALNWQQQSETHQKAKAEALRRQKVMRQARLLGIYVSDHEREIVALSPEDNAMTPIAETWRKIDVKYQAQRLTRPRIPASKGLTEPVLAAAKLALQKKDSYQDPLEPPWAYSTGTLMRDRAVTLAKAHPVEAYQTILLIDRLARKFANSRSPLLVRAGLRLHSLSITSYFESTAMAAGPELGSIDPLLKPLDVKLSDKDRLVANANFLLESVERMSESKTLVPFGESPESDRQINEALRDPVALEDARFRICAYFNKAKTPTHLSWGDFKLHADEGKGKALLIMDAILRPPNSFDVGEWDRAVPIDLVPWFVKASMAGGKAPAGIAGARDKQGDPIHFEKLATGFRIATFGRNGRNDGMVFGDDRFIVFESKPTGIRAGYRN